MASQVELDGFGVFFFSKLNNSVIMILSPLPSKLNSRRSVSPLPIPQLPWALSLPSPEAGTGCGVPAGASPRGRKERI